MTICVINRKLLSLKINYFLTCASQAGVKPLIPVYAKEMGIRSDAMGYIFAVISFVTLLSKPVIGGLVDHFQKLKVVLISLALLSIAAVIGLNFIPAPILNSGFTSNNSSLICLQNTSYVLSYGQKECRTMNDSICFDPCISSCSLFQVSSDICKTSSNENSTNSSEIIAFHIPMNCIQTILEKCHTDGETRCNEECVRNSTVCSNESNVNTTLQVWLLGLFTSLIYICFGSIASLSDTACFNVLGDKPEMFGRQRLWGAFGWGTFGLITGYLNEVFTGNSQTHSFSAGFYLMAVLMLIDLTALIKLEVKEVQTSKNIFNDVSLLLEKPRIIHFIFQVFFSGVLNGISETYLFWYLRSLNASQLVLGLNTIIRSILGNLPFFFFSGWIITKIGHVNTFTMSFAAHGIRFLYYSFILNPWWGSPMEIMGGPCFGLFYAAMASYAKVVAPTGTEATMQGVASATFEGVGLAARSLLGGYGFRILEERNTFFWTGIISFMFAIGNSIANAALKVKNSTP